MFSVRILRLAISGLHDARMRSLPQPSIAVKFLPAQRLCSKSATLSEVDYENIADETLDSLADYFEGLSDIHDLGLDYDVNYSQGVLTVKFGGSRGTYVINKQTPNKQIWLSSPTSGPKRYDFVNKCWFYPRERKTLHQLLSGEISVLLNSATDFSNCSYGSNDK